MEPQIQGRTRRVTRQDVLHGGLSRDDQYPATTSAVYLDQTERLLSRQYHIACSVLECFAAKQQTSDNPTYAQAMKCSDWKKWKAAIETELSTLRELK